MTPARELDLVAARAWPPLEQERLGDWLLRFGGGVTRRSNSVLPLGPEDGSELEPAELDARIAAVEAAYAARGLPARFQLTASSWPSDLVLALERRGYAEGNPALVLTRRLDPAEAIDDTRASGRPAPSRAWLDTWWKTEPRGGPTELATAQAILARIEPETRFAACHDAEGVAGVGLGILHGDWLGVYCMATLPRARRRGSARAVLGHLLAWGAAGGAICAHLSVSEGNEAAQTLYESAGFAVVQRYRYFTRASA